MTKFPGDPVGVAHGPDDVAISRDMLETLAAHVLRRASELDLRIATCESCTGGLLASLLTDVEGLSHGFDRGFVLYTDRAKAELLDVPESFVADHGAVSAPVAEAMAKGILCRSDARLAVAITGFAGPAGPDDEIGLVFVATAQGDEGKVLEMHLGRATRDMIRDRAVHAALLMLRHAMA